MPEKKASAPRTYRAYLENEDGSANRTVEVVAKDRAAAERAVRRQAEDIAEQYGTDPYEIKSLEAV